MFSNLIKLMCAYVNVKPYVLGREMGYKTPSAFQTVITGKDIRLSVLLAICNALHYQVIITDGKAFSINVNDYLTHNAHTDNPTE